MRLVLKLLVPALLLPAVACQARPIQLWPYDKLSRESDLVVIANAIETKDVSNTDKSLGSLAKDVVQQVETVFFIRLVFKGSLENSRITLVHFRYRDDPKTPIFNGPGLVHFSNEGSIVEITDSAPRRVVQGGPDCLLFLRLRKDGHYEPVAGQMDPFLSVRKIGYIEFSVPGLHTGAKAP